MAKSREQKRAAKAKKRVETRKKSPRRVRVGARAAAGAAPQASGNDPLSAEKLAELGYDPNIEVDVAAWKGLEERERLSRVAKYHNATLKKAHMPPSMQRHAAMHVIVESQIADAAPAEAKSALERLRGEGMSRHNAVHAIGWLATEHMRRAMAKQRPVDDKAYAKDLTTLTGHNWLKMAGLKSS